MMGCIITAPLRTWPNSDSINAINRDCYVEVCHVLSTGFINDSEFIFVSVGVPLQEWQIFHREILIANLAER